MGYTKKEHCVFSTRWQASYLELEMSNYSRFGNRNSAGTVICRLYLKVERHISFLILNILGIMLMSVSIRTFS